eukprot:301849-Hanusia_phi.AAC.4
MLAARGTSRYHAHSDLEVLLGRLDKMPLHEVARLSEDNSFRDLASKQQDERPYDPRFSAASMQPSSLAGVAPGSGTAKDPLLISMAEPSFKQQIWRTVRTLAMA